jgi:hypothetical protein
VSTVDGGHDSPRMSVGVGIIQIFDVDKITRRVVIATEVER